MVLKMNRAITIFGGIIEDEYLKYRNINKETLRKSREHIIHSRNHEREKLHEVKLHVV